MKIVPKVVDIFHGDSVTDFAKAKAFGIRGVIHKATEGSSIIDPAYGRRRKLAAAAGMLWGAYHFIRPGDMAVQARSFLDEADPDAQTLMALDHEDEAVSLASARAFVEAVEAIFGRRLVLYSGFLIKEQVARASATDASVADVAFFAARRFWLAQYAASPLMIDSDRKPLPWAKPWLWQFTGDGLGPQPHAVPGIENNMDINAFDGTDDELAATWAGEPLSAAAAAETERHASQSSNAG